MGEAYPPTAVDYASNEARNAKAMAQGTIMRIQQVEERLTTLEDTILAALRLLDGTISELSTRITRLEQR